MSRVRKLALVTIVAVLFGVPAAAVLARWYVLRAACAHEVEEPRDVPATDTAIVLGGAPRFVQDRIETAAELYRWGKVKRVLLTGDQDIDNTAAMRQEALRLGVPESALLVDEEADRTLTSCRRAKSKFNLERVVVVTQRFHLPRAVYLCRALGPAQAIGVVADRGLYGHARIARLRETPASLRAVLDVAKDAIASRFRSR